MRLFEHCRSSARLICIAVSFACACDPKAGFESAAGAIDPNEKSYVDGPGSLLTSGPFNSVGIDFDADTGVHLLARRRDDQGQSMTLFGQDAQNGCRIAPNVATWFAAKPTAKPYRLLPFLDSRDATGAGTLHFSSIDCKVEPYSLDNALGPTDPELEQGFLIRQGKGLVLADPWSATTQPIVSDFRRLILTGSQFLIWGDSQLIVFDQNVTELARFGNNVSAVTDLDFGDAFAVQDDDGLHALIFDFGSETFSFQMVDPEACGLGPSPAALDWVLVHSPCNDQRLVGERVDPKGMPPDRLPFTTPADPQSARIEGFSDGGTSLSDATAYYLANVDATTGLGTLFATTPDGPPFQVGQNAVLDRVSLVNGNSAWAGAAVVDIDDGLGRLVRWNWDGSLETLAENVDQAAFGLGFLSNFDGHAGDFLSLDANANVSVVQVGSPPSANTLRSNDYEWALRLEHFDGVAGDLTLAQGLDAPFVTAAKHVAQDQYQFLSLVPLPGFAYLGDYDEKALSGTLFVQNLTLGSTLAVAKGVSDFTATNYPLPGILYAVPAGPNAGLWFARAK
jgi:hypothetical protein